jgi:catechol 2,3-dioxygenase-like lactoylglutathione lyase family enzyme
VRLLSQQIEEFLRSRGAGQLPHPGGTLYEHLIRVAGLLADWGASEDLRLAGLCHACYGTAGYPNALLGLDERAVLTALAGARVESLVYLYGSCDRAAVHPALKEPGPVPFRDRFTGRTRTPPERDIRAFTELTAANELDVVRHNPALAAEQGAALRELFRGVRARLTDAAWQAWNQQPGLDPAREPGAGEPEAGRQTPPVTITGLDHLVLTVADLDQTTDFYQRVLGMRPVTFGTGRRALEFGTSKINLHQAGQGFTPYAAHPVPGSADLCLITTAPPGQILDHLGAQHVPVEAGPVPRTGARGTMTSIYIRDPDGNLIEIASYPEGPAAGQPR